MRLTISQSGLKVFLVLAVGVLSAKADAVVGGSWNSWSTSILATPGSGAYWNNADPGDGGNANIGWCLVGGGNCTIPNPPGNLQFLSSGGGNAPSNFYLTNTGTANSGELLVSITSNSSHDTFGWYNLVGGVPVLNPLLSGSQTGSTVLFTPSASYGFYIQDQLGTFFSQSTYDSNKDAFQAFALFQQVANSSFYLGVEDGGASGDRDYNDMVIHLTAVPEPASLALIGGTLMLVGAFIRLRRVTAK